MSDTIIFRKGAALGASSFVAAAALASDDASNEPAPLNQLIYFTVDGGWNALDLGEQNVADLASLNGRGFALTDTGALLDAGTGDGLATLAETGGITFTALAANETMLFAAANAGFYAKGTPESGFALVTDQTIIPQPAWDAPRAEKRAYSKSLTVVFNADVSPADVLAVTELRDVVLILADGELAKPPAQRIAVGVTWDAQSESFWVCGHSPVPYVAQLAEMTAETVWEGAGGEVTCTDLAVHDGGVYLASPDNQNAGLYVVKHGVLQTADIPAGFGTKPVWKIESRDGVLWALRSDDLLRHSGDTWEQFPFDATDEP